MGAAEHFSVNEEKYNWVKVKNWRDLLIQVLHKMAA